MELYSRIEGQGRPLLILHGFLGLSDNWKTLSSKYAAAGFEVHVPDLRNHGHSPHSDIFSYQAMVEDVIEYCARHLLQTVNIIGHSMGGKAAMRFAVENPAMVERLIVADIGPKQYAPHHGDILAGLAAIDFAAKPDRKSVDATLAQYVPDDSTRQFLMKSLFWREPGQLAWRFNLDAFLKNEDLIGEALSEDAVFAKPTLFIRGSESKYIRDEDMDAIKKHFPMGLLETIEGAGHWLHAEKPEIFLQKTLTFLNAI